MCGLVWMDVGVITSTFSSHPASRIVFIAFIIHNKKSLDRTRSPVGMCFLFFSVRESWSIKHNEKIKNGVEIVYVMDTGRGWRRGEEGGGEEGGNKRW